MSVLPGPPRALHGHVGRYLRDYPALVRPALALAVPALRSYAAQLVRRRGTAPDLLDGGRGRDRAALRAPRGRCSTTDPYRLTPGTGERTHS